MMKDECPCEDGLVSFRTERERESEREITNLGAKFLAMAVTAVLLLYGWRSTSTAGTHV